MLKLQSPVTSKSYGRFSPTHPRARPHPFTPAPLPFLFSFFTLPLNLTILGRELRLPPTKASGAMAGTASSDGGHRERRRRSGRRVAPRRRAPLPLSDGPGSAAAGTRGPGSTAPGTGAAAGRRCGELPRPGKIFFAKNFSQFFLNPFDFRMNIFLMMQKKFLKFFCSPVFFLKIFLLSILLEMFFWSPNFSLYFLIRKR